MPAPFSCDVLGIGESSFDEVYRLPGLPSPGGATKMAILDALRGPGGQVATTLCTCAALGRTARYVGTTGNDDHGRRIRDELQRRSIDLTSAPVRAVPSRHAVILVDDQTGERVVLWRRDPELALRPDEVPADAVRTARLLHVDAVDEDVAIHAARLGRDAGIPVTSDIDHVTARTPDLVAAVTIPIFGEGVVETLTGQSDVERALRALRQRHDGWLCVTRGARGAMLLAGDRLHEAPAFRVEAVDTTGAGDVFRGAFIDALLRGDDPPAILRFANAAAAVSCTRPGAIGGVPTRAEVDALVSDRHQA